MSEYDRKFKRWFKRNEKAKAYRLVALDGGGEREKARRVAQMATQWLNRDVEPGPIGMHSEEMLSDVNG